VLADPTQLELAVLNLDQCARRMPEAAGCRSPPAGDVTDDPEMEPGNISSSASANRAGMPAEVAARAFEPSSPPRRWARARGLGLSMVYGVARQSGVSHGSKAGLARDGPPLTSAAPRVPRADDCPSEEGRKPPPPAGRRVLVVDDDPDVRALSSSLEDLGYEVREAATRGGADEFRRETPDLVCSTI
jgi:CheY-like chemotaxis protein